MKTTDYRRDFPLLMQETAAYLDNAATAQRPQCVLDAEKTFYETQNANPLRGLYPLSIAATEAVEEARLAVRDFLHAKSSQEIIFTRNTTEALNLVAYSYGLSHVHAGDEWWCPSWSITATCCRGRWCAGKRAQRSNSSTAKWMGGST